MAAQKRQPKPIASVDGVPGKDPFPIPDKNHAVAALARAASQQPSIRDEVRRKVREAYPDLPSSKGEGNSQAAKATKRSAKQ